MMHRRIAIVLCLLCATLPLGGQTPPPVPATDQPVFRAETTLVEVSAVVIDRAGNPVLDLELSEFEVLEDGEPREIVGFRQLVSDTTARSTRRVHVPGARTEVVASNTEHRDAPVFVLLLDDLNISPYNAHRAIRGGLGLLDALPEDALIGVLSTSGLDGTALTLGPRNDEHTDRVKAFRGQLILAGPPPKRFTIQTTPSTVAAPCGVGSAVLQSQDCADPTRAERRARTLQAVGEALERAGSRRKVVFWMTEDMGVSPITPDGSRAAQRDALQAVLGADVTVYPVNTIGNMAHGPDADDEEPDDGRPDRRTGVSIKLGTGQTITTDTDDLVAVTLFQLARETGGRWIRQIDQLDEELATVVRQNSAAYLLAYESPNARVPGRHRIDVRVARPDTRVYARRGFIVPREEAETTAAAPGRETTATLTDLLQRVVPQGDLGLRVLVTPMLADGRQGRAFATVQVDAASARGQDVALALVTFDERGAPANQQTVRFSQQGANDVWEAAVELTIARGTHQLRAAAVTADGTRHGLVVERIVSVGPGRDLYLGPPMLLAVDADADATSLHPTLQRAFDVGHPLAVQSEIAGRPVSDGKVEVAAHLVAADGTVVREGSAVIEPGAKRDRARATAVVPTHGLVPGTYALVTEARGPGRGEPLRHAMPVSLRAAASTGRGETPTARDLGANPASAGAEPLAPDDVDGERTARTAEGERTARRAVPTTAVPTTAVPTGAVPTSVTTLPVAHGPTSLFDRGGTHVIRTTTAWAMFWKHLPTRQAAPEIDFDRVTVLAVVLDDGPGRVPEISGTRGEDDGLVVAWRAVDANAPTVPGPTRPFVVVGITDYDGPIRFERVE